MGTVSRTHSKTDQEQECESRYRAERVLNIKYQSFCSSYRDAVTSYVSDSTLGRLNSAICYIDVLLILDNYCGESFPVGLTFQKLIKEFENVGGVTERYMYEINM